MSCENWMVLWSKIRIRECVEFQARQDDSVNKHLNFYSMLFSSKLSRPIDRWTSLEKLVDVVLTSPFKIRKFSRFIFHANVMLLYERLFCVILVILVSRNREGYMSFVESDRPFQIGLINLISWSSKTYLPV